MGVNSVNIKLRNANNQEVTYTGVETVTFPGTTSGTVETFTAGEPVSNVPIELDFSDGDQVVDAPPGYVVRSAVIVKPEGIEQVVAKGVSAAGITGQYVTPGTTKSVALDFSGGNMDITATGDERWDEIDIEKPAGLIPENIKSGIAIAGITGNLESIVGDLSGGKIKYLIPISQNFSRYSTYGISSGQVVINRSTTEEVRVVLFPPAAQSFSSGYHPHLLSYGLVYFNSNTHYFINAYFGHTASTTAAASAQNDTLTRNSNSTSYTVSNLAVVPSGTGTNRTTYPIGLYYGFIVVSDTTYSGVCRVSTQNTYVISENITVL